MSNKLCINKGNLVTYCDSLDNCINKGLGDLAMQTRVNLKTSEVRTVVTIGRFKKNRVGINFCPACGENIETFFKSNIEERPD